MHFDYLDFGKLEPGDTFRMRGVTYVFKKAGTTQRKRPDGTLGYERPWLQFELDGVRKKYQHGSPAWDTFCRDTEGCVGSHHGKTGFFIEGDGDIPPHLDDAGALVKCVVIDPKHIR